MPEEIETWCFHLRPANIQPVPIHIILTVTKTCSSLIKLLFTVSQKLTVNQFSFSL